MAPIRITIISLIALMQAGICHAQQSDTLKLFYHIDERNADRQFKRLDSALSVRDSITSITVTGYADYLGTSPYNQKLSADRAKNIAVYIQARFPRLSVSWKGGGMQTGITYVTGRGRQQDRRVDVVINRFKRELPAPAIPIPADTTPPPQKPEQLINKLTELEVGESLDIKELLFQPGRHYLAAQSYPYLDVLLKIMQTHPTLRIQIVGHICCDYEHDDGFDYDNHKYGLSKWRAKFLYDYLADKGIARNRMKWKGVGSTAPKVFPEASKEDEATNRRVEIVVLEK